MLDKQKILEAFAAQPWMSFQMEGIQIIQISENISAVVYKVTAQREDSDPYTALINSTYVRSNNGWELVLHQQTPA